MNRKKKINSILKKKLKKANSKLHTSNKPKYISKAERERLANIESLEANSEQGSDASQVSSSESKTS